MNSKKEDDEQSGNMYNFNDEGSNSNQPPKQSAIRRSLGDEDNSYKYNQNENDEQNAIENGEQNAIRRSLGDKNPNANEFPNYVEKVQSKDFLIYKRVIHLLKCILLYLDNFNKK